MALMMTHLPPEMILGIFFCLGKKLDIKNFRLVRKDYAELGRGPLFQSVNISPSAKSLDRFKTLSHRRAIGIHVKEVILHLGDFSDLIWLPFLESLRLSRVDIHQAPRQLVSWYLQEEIQSYYALLNGLYFPHVILRGFEHCPMIQAIVIKKFPYQYTETQLRQQIQVWYRLDLGVFDHMVYSHWGSQIESYQFFKVLIEAAYNTKAKIQAIEVERGVSIDERNFFGDADLLTVLSDVFQHCRIVKLDFYILLIPPPQRSQARFLRYALETAGQLKVLALSASSSAYLPLDALLDTQHVWRNLKELGVSSVESRDDFLKNFVTRHLSTLGFVVLQDLRLTSGTWDGPNGLDIWLDRRFPS